MTHLIHQNQLRIVAAGKDIGNMYDLVQMAGWNQTLEDLKLLAEQNPQSNLKAVADIGGISKALGSGLVLNVGESLAWIGMILVHPEHRRKGVASAVMERCMEVARLAMDNSIVGLDATPAGLQVYKKMGFEGSFKIWRCQLKTDTTVQTESAMELIHVLYVDKYTNMLQKLDLRQKLAGLRLIHKMHPDGTWVAQLNGQPIGIVMTRPGRIKPFIGPLVANSPDVARNLLDHVLKYWREKGHDEVFVDIPEKHFRSASQGEIESKCTNLPTDCILGTDIEAARCFIRMYEVISNDNFTRLSKRNVEGNKHLRSGNALRHGNASYNATLVYMKQEKKALQYIYATGGPELS